MNEQIKELAALLFTPAEIAFMLEIDENDVSLSDGLYYRAYQEGRLQAEVDLRNSIFKLAKSGSSPAQQMMLDILKKSNAKMVTGWAK